VARPESARCIHGRLEPLRLLHRKLRFQPLTLPHFSLSGTPLAGCILSSITLDLAGAGGQAFASANCPGRSNPDAFTLADYSTPGIYSFVSVSAGVNDGLIVTAVQTPEPSTVALVLLGVGIAFAIRRKRIAQGHPQFA
jgi:hypothetical protein